MLVGLIYVLQLREQFRGAEPKWGDLQDSSRAVLMLPPVLCRGEKLLENASGLPVATLLPAGMCWGGYSECHPEVSCFVFPPKSKALNPSSASPLHAN